MNVCIQADAVAVGRALIAALLFVGERAASFSEAKFDDTAFGSVLKRWRTHWTSRNWPEQFVETGSTRFLQRILCNYPGVWRARNCDGKYGRRPFKKRTADIAAAFEEI